MQARYWELVCVHAIRATKDRLSLSWGLAFRTVLVSGAGVGLSWLLTGWATAVTTAIAVFIGIIAANLVVLVFVFVVQLCLAPAAIHFDQLRRIEALTIPKPAHALAVRLAELSEYAVHNLWAKAPSGNSEEEVTVWRSLIEQWHQGVLREMEKGGCDFIEIQSVRVLGNLRDFGPPGGGHYHGHGTINTGLTMIEGYRKRLEKIIEKYQRS